MSSALYILVSSEWIKWSGQVLGKEIRVDREAKSHKKCQDDLLHLDILFLVCIWYLFTFILDFVISEVLKLSHYLFFLT